MNLFDMSPLKEKEAHFRRLLDVANLGALTPQERAIYDENLKIYRDWKATMEYAVENAEAKGSRLTALRTAWNLKRIGLDPSVIAQCTGLSLEEINDLENLIRNVCPSSSPPIVIPSSAQKTVFPVLSLGT